jgi:hypothetical protein
MKRRSRLHPAMKSSVRIAASSGTGYGISLSNNSLVATDVLDPTQSSAADLAEEVLIFIGPYLPAKKASG